MVKTQLEHVVALANSRYFRNRLKNVKIKWKKPKPKETWIARTKSHDGSKKFLIEVDPRIKRLGAYTVMVVFHELVHVEQWDKVTNKTCHGRRFQKRMKQLAAKGAFNGLW